MSADVPARERPCPESGGLAAPMGDRPFALAVQFNLLPATYADPSWLQLLDPAGSPGTLERTPPSAFWAKRLSRRLLEAWDLDRMYDFDFADPGKRVALMEPPALTEASLLTAAVLVRSSLRTIVHGPTVAQLHEALGANAHRIALSWEIPTPELPRVFTELPAETPDPEQWARHAMALAAEVIPPAATGVSARMRFKFPRWDAQSAATSHLHRQLNEPQRRGLVAVFTALVRQQLPAWSWLFDPA
ncbi:MAG: SctK family type III secretion system sorting platform protein [Ectothiorhodospiraceae bacterium]|nr:SctK family type III secretion system sorting platform protein [Ectothiorhodospiraceae bacterium]MCH8503876.1 Yop proteins translocation protein K [Ectothiorhodospiraceae bacterium]